MDNEICICAAINVAGRVIRGHRHCHCITTAISMYIPAVFMEQGFITSKNRFVGRKEAMQLQLAAGIDSVAVGGYRGDSLYSEDLY
jgi:hypothetical protein